MNFSTSIFWCQFKASFAFLYVAASRNAALLRSTTSQCFSILLSAEAWIHTHTLEGLASIKQPSKATRADRQAAV